MTQEERRELAHAQREVMWNLQKDEVVTIVRQGDDPVPYKRQGNPAVNTPISVRKRLALRNKPLIQVLCGKRYSDSPQYMVAVLFPNCDKVRDCACLREILNQRSRTLGWHLYNRTVVLLSGCSKGKHNVCGIKEVKASGRGGDGGGEKRC